MTSRKGRGAPEEEDARLRMVVGSEAGFTNSCGPEGTLRELWLASRAHVRNSSGHIRGLVFEFRGVVFGFRGLVFEFCGLIFEFRGNSSEF